MIKPNKYVRIKMTVHYEDDGGEIHTGEYSLMAEFASEALCHAEEIVEAVETKNRWTAIKIMLHQEKLDEEDQDPEGSEVVAEKEYA